VTITGQDFRTQSPTLSWHLSRAAPSLTFANTRRPENCFMRRYMLQKRTASSHSEYNFRKPYIANFHVARPFMIKPGALVQGESGRMYRLLSPLFAQVSKNASNVWRAVDEQDESLEFVVKEPSPHDDASLDWPLFQHEVQMQRRFSKSPFIRQMVDFIPRSNSTRTMMVLQAFEKSLWTARNKRPLTMDEIKWIMKAVLIALWTIHREGLVYSGGRNPLH
jgi:hypothetical protein